MRFINRDYTRTEHDDFFLNVVPKLDDNLVAIPVYVQDELVGWNIVIPTN